MGELRIGDFGLRIEEAGDGMRVMDDDGLLGVLKRLGVMARLYAARVLSPGESIDAAWSQAADEYCLRLARHMEAEEPTPEVAAALLPRLAMIEMHGRAALRVWRRMGRAGDKSFQDAGNLLERLLIHSWHLHWKGTWNAADAGGAAGHKSSGG